MNVPEQIAAIAALLDGHAGRYKSLNGAGSFRAYLETARPREDEELLTEPLLADILESLLGFPQDAYVGVAEKVQLVAVAELCALYGIEPKLTEVVVASAVARPGRWRQWRE